MGGNANIGDQLKVLRGSALGLTAGGNIQIQNMMTVAGVRDANKNVLAYTGVNLHADGDFRLADYMLNNVRQETALNIEDARFILSTGTVGTDGTVLKNGATEISHLNVNNMIGEITATGWYVGKTLTMDAAALDIDGMAGVRIASDENDDERGRPADTGDCDQDTRTESEELERLG